MKKLKIRSWIQEWNWKEIKIWYKSQESKLKIKTLRVKPETL